ncbi:hypothetical protein [Corynebacterium oculi]|uniref:Uncharacterized protein n=1 Tax=Corynebacterium oculi TaxID=1544416 RepID=A0A0Q0YM78_9CORY|nr:hypothetical protein [Corynebacterium oculi]KQB83547.1 hypothetical protein Cocul_01617 [Corynebacterium oculi]
MSPYFRALLVFMVTYPIASIIFQTYGVTALMFPFSAVIMTYTYSSARRENKHRGESEKPSPEEKGHRNTT